MYLSLFGAFLVTYLAAGAIAFIVFWLNGQMHPEPSSKTLFLSWRHGRFQANSLSIVFICPIICLGALFSSGDGPFPVNVLKALLGTHLAPLAYLIVLRRWRENKVWTVYYLIGTCAFTLCLTMPELLDIRIPV